jgi:PPK2 family polyphosphate:nucleotide phosphotransferase
MEQKYRFDLSVFRVPHDRKISLKDYDPGYTGQLKGKKQSKKALSEDIADLARAQELLWASAQYSLLIIFQAMDAAGKDGTIKHVMTGINPQGTDVYSFKAPTEEQRLHHFMWRPNQFLPRRGRIAIFNRSYYEEVLVVRVHPDILKSQWLPTEQKNMDLEQIWLSRFEDINEFELRWKKNGIEVIKFFLNLSYDEQRKRFYDRLENADKNWKFSGSDYKERAYWDDYQHAFEEMLNHTSSEHTPWYVVPADNKWYMRAVVADVITSRIDQLDLEYPEVSKDKLKELEEIKKKLVKEGPVT